MYRKVEVRVWGDAGFRKLSAPQPCGRYLWFRLITGPELTPLPGLICMGRLAFAEAMEWSSVGFDKAFAEVTTARMATADWKSRVILVPKALVHNPPESPNVVRGWRAFWDVVPECDLKFRWLTLTQGFLEGFTEAFREAFQEAFGEVLAKAIANHEHEHEHEHEPEHEHEARVRVRPVASRFVPPEFQLTDDLRAYALKCGLDDAAISEQLESFRLYEFAKPKSDWPRTWMRWARTAVQIRARDAEAPASGGAFRRPTTAAGVTMHNVRGFLAEDGTK